MIDRHRRIVLACSLTLITCLVAVTSADAAVSVSTLAQGFNASGDVAVAPDGSIYVGNYGGTLSNANGNAVVKVTTDGQVSTFATGFSGASGNEFDAQGNLFQSNIGAAAVMRIDPQGNVETYATGTQSPIGVTLDPAGNLYVNSCNNNLIYKVDTNRVRTVYAQSVLLNCPNGLTIDDQGNLYAVNFNAPTIIKIDTQGQASILAQTTGGSFRPQGGHGHVTFGNGVLYVVSNASGQIYEVTLDGQTTVIAGNGNRGHLDGDPLSSSFIMPNGIDISPDGRFLYINESEVTTAAQLTGSYPLLPSRLRVVELFEESEEMELDINAGMTGTWFNPDTPGQGLLIEPIPSTNGFFAAWFTFDQAVMKIGSPDHRWFTLQGVYDAGSASLDIFVNSGGVFDAPDPVTTDPVGSATITFSDCVTAVMDYAFDDGPAGTVPLSRLTPDTLCTVLSEPGETP